MADFTENAYKRKPFIEEQIKIKNKIEYLLSLNIKTEEMTEILNDYYAKYRELEDKIVALKEEEPKVFR